MSTVLLWLTPLLIALVGLINAYGVSLTKKSNESAVASAVSSAKILDLADKTHALVNSQMGVQLSLNATTSRTLANLTQDATHIKAAEEAEKRLAEHQARQAVADQKETQ